jgi:hypothetical protein
MKLHANARSCPNSRRLLVRRVEEGWSLAAAAEAAGVSGRTGRKWVARWRIEGDAGLVDRSSAPRRNPVRLTRQQQREPRAERPKTPLFIEINPLAAAPAEAFRDSLDDEGACELESVVAVANRAMRQYGEGLSPSDLIAWPQTSDRGRRPIPRNAASA